MKSTVVQINVLSKQPSLSVMGLDSVAKYQNFTKIVQRKCWSKLVFDIVDFEGTKLLTVEGPGALSTFLNSVTMEVKTVNGDVIGKITNEWSGALQETLTDADNFCVCCPAETAACYLLPLRASNVLTRSSSLTATQAMSSLSIVSESTNAVLCCALLCVCACLSRPMATFIFADDYE